MKKSKAVIAIDLGGTKITAAVVTDKGVVKHQITEASYLAGGWVQLKKQIVRICRELSSKEKNINCVAIGSAGPLHAEKGILLDPTNFGWKKQKIISIVGDLKKELKTKVILENDAAVAAWGEYWKGKASENSICITLGTGLGVGIIINGKQFRGRNGLHPEIGHLVLRPQDPYSYCECGVKGCAEGFLSGVNFAKWVARSTGEAEHSAKELTELAAASDARIKKYFEEYSNLMSQYLESLIVTTYPQEIIFSGSFASAHKLFLPQVKSQLKEAFKRHEKSHKIIPQLLVSNLGNKSGLIGAAYLAFKA